MREREKAAKVHWKETDRYRIEEKSKRSEQQSVKESLLGRHLQKTSVNKSQ